MVRSASRRSLWLPVAAIFLDGTAVVLGAWLAYAVRFSSLVAARVPLAHSLPPLEWYIRLSFVLGGLTLLLMLLKKLYRYPIQEGLFDELGSALRSYISAFTLLLAALFFYREVTFSRATMALLLLFSGVGLILSRSAGRTLRQALHRVGIAVRRAAVVGEGKQAARIFEHLSAHPEFGLSMIGEVCERPPVSVEVKRLGAVSEVRRVIQEHHIDTLIIAPEQDGPDPLPALIKACYGINVDFLYLPDIMPASGRPRRVVKVGGVPLWTLKEAPFTGWPGVGKRAFDCVIGSLMFLGALPVLILTAFAIKLDSRGPLIYKQRRVGLDGREFDCLKFRSMRVDAEAQTGAVWAVKDDPRVSRVGKFIRRWSVDELPQLWNVLRGDMSLVGPRPERPEFVRQFEQRIDGYHERHRVRSGLTGWAQINGLRGDTPIEDRTVYDRYYVENWSLFFDLKILFLTFAAILRGENSY